MKRALLLAVFVAMAASFTVLLVARERTHSPSQAEDFAHLPRPENPSALWPSPDFAFTAHNGKTVSKASLAGRPYIANFIFTSCRTVCPLLTAKMVRLQRELAQAPLRFVSFSVDPDHDSLSALAAYAQQWNADETRWSLLATTPEGLKAVASGFHITAEPVDGGVDAVLHSAVFILVDGRGVVRGVFDLEDAKDFRALVQNARSLLGASTPAPPTQPRSGEVLYHELSCANCHERAELAPPLGGLLGRRRTLETGLLVTADEGYFKESILAPLAKRVAGFPLQMPSYAGHLSMAELDELVKYLLTLPAPSALDAEVSVAIDPVCHMKVRKTPNALHSGEVYFCSEWCQARFTENPDAYGSH